MDLDAAVKTVCPGWNAPGGNFSTTTTAITHHSGIQGARVGSVRHLLLAAPRLRHGRNPVPASNAYADDADAARASPVERSAAGDFPRPVFAGTAVASFSSTLRRARPGCGSRSDHHRYFGREARLKGVYVVIDGNPSPLAAHFTFGPKADPRSLKMRGACRPVHRHACPSPRRRTASCSLPPSS